MRRDVVGRKPVLASMPDESLADIVDGLIWGRPDPKMV